MCHTTIPIKLLWQQTQQSACGAKGTSFQVATHHADQMVYSENESDF